MSYKVEAVLSAVDLGFTAQFDKATKAIEKLQKQANKVGDFSKNLGAGVEKIGRSLTKGLTIPIGVAFTAAGKNFAEFEQGLVGVGKTTGLAGNDLKDFGDEISKMSSAIPASTTDLLQLAETAGQLGIHGKKDLLEFTKVMAEMGSATNLAGEEGAKSLARFANIMGLDVGQNIRQVGNAVVRLGNNFATSEGEIMEMAKRLSASGRLVGVTTPGVLALATAMSSVGINAEAGGTAMSTIMKKIGDYAVGNKGRIEELNKKLSETDYTIEDLYDLIDMGGDGVNDMLYGVATKIGMTKKELKSTVIAAAEGEKKLTRLAEVSGMSAEEFSAAWSKDPAMAIQAFMKGLDNLQQSGGDMSQVLDELGIKGIRETNAVKSLAQNHELLADAIMQSNDAYMYGNDLAEEAAQAWESLGSKLKMFVSTIGNIARDIFSIIAPALKEFISRLNDIARKWYELSDATKESVGQIVLKVGALLAAIGPLFLVGGKIIQTMSPVIGVLSQVGNAFSGFTGLVNPLMDGFAKKVGLAMAISGNKLAGFAPMVTKSIDLANIAMKALFPAAVIGMALAGLGILYSKFGEQIDQLLAIARDKGPEIIINLANGISQRISDLVAKGAEMISKLAEAIAANLPAILTAGTNIVISLVQGVGNNADKLIASAVKIIGSLLQGIAQNLPRLLAAGLELVGKLVMGIAQNLPLIIESAGKAIVSFIQGLSDSTPKITSGGIQIIVELVKAIIMSIPKVIEAGIKIVIALGQAILKGLGNIFTTVKDGVLGFFKNIFSPGKKKADETGRDIGVSMDNLIVDIDRKTSNMGSIMDKNADTAKTNVLGSFGDMSSQAASDVSKMAEQTGRSMTDIANIASRKSSDMKSSVTSANADVLRDTGRKFADIQNDMSTKYGRGVDDVKRSSSELSGRIPSDVGQMSNQTAREYENLSIRMTKSANDMDRAVSKSFNNISNNINSSLSKINTNANSGLNNLGASFNRSFNSIANTVNQGVNKVIVSINNMNSRLNSSFNTSFNRLTSMTKTMWNNFISVANSSLNRYYSTFNITLNKTNSIYIDHSSRIKSKTVSMWNSIISATNQGANNMARSFAQAGNCMRAVSSNIANSVVGAFRGLGNSMYNLGRNAGIGFNNGLASTQNIIYSMANNIAYNVANRIRSALSIHSPSRVMMGLGSYAGEGLAIGLEKSKRYVNSAVDGLSDSIQGVNTSFNSRYIDLDSNRQAIPIVVNLKMGRNEFRAMSRDITQEQGRDLRLEANFDI